MADGTSSFFTLQNSSVASTLKGLPTGGVPGQALEKLTSNDYDVGWVNVTGGGAGTPNTLVSNATLLAGTALHVDLVLDKLVAADRTAYATAEVVGLLASNVTAGFSGTIIRDVLTLADWSAATGATSLLSGQTYFLGTAGLITTIVPSSGYLVAIGTARDPQTMVLAIQRPVQF